MTIKTRTYRRDEFHRLIEGVQDAERWELIDGEIVEKMPTLLHGWIVALLIARIMVYLEAHPIGWVIAEGRYSIPDDDRNSRIPDVSFVSKTTTDALTPVGAAPFMPDLAVEIASPNQPTDALLDKAEYYLSNGTRLVWVVIPSERIVHVLTPESRQALAADDRLTGDAVLPDFELPIRGLFRSDLT